MEGLDKKAEPTINAPLALKTTADELRARAHIEHKQLAITADRDKVSHALSIKEGNTEDAAAHQ